MTRRQLVGAGLTNEQVKVAVRKGLLLRQHRGVYRLGHRAPSVEATYLAAVLACGDGAVLAGCAAAHVYGIIKGRDLPRPEAISVGDRCVHGVATHRARRIDRRDVTRYRGLPITTVPRTLVDLARVLPLGALAEAFHHAEVLHNVKPAGVEAVLARRPNAAGAANLRAVIEGDALILLSRLERAFVALLRGDGLPLPRTNRPAGGRYVDCRWPGRCLTVELDSYRFHHSRHAWERDQRRAREAYARGDEFRRYTYGDVVERPDPVLSELRPLLR